MTALGDALTMGQAKALNAIERAYVSGDMEAADVLANLDAIGCTDKVDQGHLLAVFTTLKTLGVATPAAPPQGNGIDRSKLTDAQRTLISKMLRERNLPDPPGLLALSRDQASELIERIKAGTYEDTPF